MAGNEFLDKAGLVVLWDRIKELVYECCCGHKDYECINDEVITSECFEKAVLSVTSGGGGGDSGFSCTETATLLTEESVTTAQIMPSGVQGSFTNLESVTADLLRVTFNGTEYICEKRNPTGSINEYGATYDMGTDTFDWSVYPFVITSLPLGTSLVTENAGTYAVKVEAVSQSVETTPCFDAAVKHVLPNTSAMILEGGNSSSDRLNYTFAEIKEAMRSGRGIIFHFAPSLMSELSEFYTQDVEVRFNNASRYVSVMFRELEQYVVYIAQSDDEYPHIPTDEPT